MKVAETDLLWPWPNTPTTFVSKDSKKWSLIINNDACLPFCRLFIIYLYCLLTGCFCLLKRSDWTLQTSWARPRSQLKHCPLSTIQNNSFDSVWRTGSCKSCTADFFMRYRIRIQAFENQVGIKTVKMVLSELRGK
jgi:hypothetical protein